MFRRVLNTSLEKLRQNKMTLKVFLKRLTYWIHKPIFICKTLYESFIYIQFKFYVRYFKISMQFDNIIRASESPGKSGTALPI